MSILAFLQVVSFFGFFMALTMKDWLGAMTCFVTFWLAYWWAVKVI